MTRASRFTVADIERAVGVADKLGLRVAGWEIAPDGTIRVLTGDRQAANDKNPLDRVLSR